MPRPVSRRELLAGAAAVGLGVSIRTRRSAGPRVAIVGAGLAGLTAAHRLRDAGCDVVVFEAAARVGGRVRTYRDDFTGGQHAEAGGEFVDGNHRRMRALVAEWGFELEPVGGDDDLLGAIWWRGGRRSAEDFEAEHPRAYEQLAALEESLDALAAPIEDPADPTTFPGAAALDRRSAADLLDDAGLDDVARFLVDNDLTQDYTVPPSQISALFLAQQVARFRDAEADDLEAFRIRGGNDRLPRAMAADLGRRVRRSTPVAAVTVRGNRAAVAPRDGTTEVDHVVLAAPLPALRSVRFDPPLPEALAGAVAELGYGRGGKVLQQYRRRVWRDDGFDGDLVADGLVTNAWEPTDAQPGPAGILTAYCVGPVPPSSEVRGAFEQVWPGTAARASVVRGARWNPTYSAYAPGQVQACWEGLRVPHGRLHLAGEHTGSFVGSMEGAVESGERAARQILDS